MASVARSRIRAANLAAIARALPRAFGIVWTAAPVYTAVSLVSTLLAGLVPVALLALTKPAVDAVTATIEGGAATDSARAFWLVLAIGGLLLLAELLSALSAFVRLALGEKVEIHVRGQVQDQSSRVEMGFYERPEYFDGLHRARDAASQRPLRIIEGLAAVARAAIAITGVAAILARYAWWLPLALGLAMIPAMVGSMALALRQYRFEMSSTEDERQAGYFDWLLTDRSAAAEVRAYALAQLFRDRYRQLREGVRRSKMAIERREAFVHVAVAALGLAVGGGAVLWMLMRAARGTATLGDVALCFQAFVLGSVLVRGAVSSFAGSYRDALFLEDFFRFLDLPADPRVPATPDGRSGGVVASRAAPPAIRFEGVRFSYPGVRRPALDGLDLTIEPGEIAAIVGANGAGKSTLVKLLCRFYDVDSGSILIDSRDVRTLTVQECRDGISVLFQDAMQFSGTVAQNILPLDAGSADAPADLERAVAAAHAESLLAGLPDGFDTRLAVWFPGGTELSGGEWQRIAMARAFARAAPILVLDEPTAAMDPWAEQGWLARLRNHAAGRTVILITHRLSTASVADRIHVMRDGRVVESGTPQALRASGGDFARLLQLDAPRPGGEVVRSRNPDRSRI